MKATYGELFFPAQEEDEVDATEARAIFKDPITDNGTKKSARGLLRVEKEGEDYILYDNQTWEQEEQGCLKTVFENSKLIVETTLEEIRNRLK